MSGEREEVISMDVLMSLIFLLGMVGFIAGLVMLVVNLFKKKSKKKAGIVLVVSWMVLVFSGLMMPDENTENGSIKKPNPIIDNIIKLRLESYNDGRFSIEKPEGWDIYTIGEGPDLGFIMKDRENPARQVFYFGSVGPVYLNQRTKDYENYMPDIYGAFWRDAPIIDPLDPVNFLSNFENIANMKYMSANFPQFPALSNVNIISQQNENNIIKGAAGDVQTQLIRAVFEQDGEVLEGMFLIETLRMDVAGYGFAYPAIGIIAPVEEYVYICDSLMESLETFRFDEEYVRQWIDSMRPNDPAGANTFDYISKNIDETSEMVSDGWNNRQQSEDISAKQWSDAMLGYDRLYDEDSGRSFYAPIQEVEEYLKHPEYYNIKNLRPLERNDVNGWNNYAEPFGENIYQD